MPRLVEAALGHLDGHAVRPAGRVDRAALAGPRRAPCRWCDTTSPSPSIQAMLSGHRRVPHVERVLRRPRRRRTTIPGSPARSVTPMRPWARCSASSAASRHQASRPRPSPGSTGMASSLKPSSRTRLGVAGGVGARPPAPTELGIGRAVGAAEHEGPQARRRPATTATPAGASAGAGRSAGIAPQTPMAALP